MVLSTYAEISETACALRRRVLESSPPPRRESVEGQDVVWQYPGPAGAPILGVLLLFPSPGRGAADFFAACDAVPTGRPLPEESKVLHAALGRGWLTACFTPANSHGAGLSIAAAARMFAARHSASVSVFAAPGAGDIALQLTRWLPELRAMVLHGPVTPAAVAAACSADSLLPPTLFVHMPLRDPAAAVRVHRAVAMLRQCGAIVAHLACGPRCVTQSYFADTVADIDVALSARMVQSLSERGLLDSSGFLRQDPCSEPFVETLRSHAVSLGDLFDEGESPVAAVLDAAWAVRGFTAEWAEESLEWCATAGATEYFWRGLEENCEVLAPWSDLSLRRARIMGPLLPEEAALMSLSAKHTQRSLLVAYEACGQLALVHSLSLVPWEHYLERVAGEEEEELPTDCRSPSATLPLCNFSSCEVHLWRGEMEMEGLFSQLFWSLGFLEQARAVSDHRCFMIDWTDRCLVAGGASPKSNLWNVFFEQPWRPAPCNDTLEKKAEAHLARCSGLRTAYLFDLWTPRRGPAGPALTTLAASAEAAGRFKPTLAFGPPHFEKFGNFVLAQPFDGERGGRLGPSLAERGRRIFRRWIGIRRDVLADVVNFFERSMGLRALAWLAVHVRLTDKRSSNALPLASLESQICRFAAALGCDGVMLCTDEADVKARLAERLGKAGLQVAIYPAALSGRGLPAHKDDALDRHQNARDMLVECLLMAQCKALLGSWSNISAATVWFAPQGYDHFLFGDAAPGEKFEAVD